MSGLRIEPVADRKDLVRFVELPGAIYADDPAWVPPLTFERLRHLDARRNPFWRGIEIRFWIARRGDQPVGRISAQVNRRHLERHGDATGHFGFLEAIDDHEVFAALVETAGAWLRERGLARMAGPFDPSINDTCGLLVAGFEHPPSMMMGHARRWYAEHLEALGFRKLRDLLAYDFDVAGDWPPAAARLVARAKRTPGLRVRPLDARRYLEEIDTICDIFNDAWAENWGFVPFDREEARYLAQEIRPLVSPGCFAIGEFDGEPAAMTVTLPNLNEAIADLGGRLLPLGWAKLLWRLKVRGVRTWRMPLMGVRRRHQNSPRGAALALAVIDAVKSWHRARGVRRAELSWVLEDNRRTRELIETVGGVPYKTYRIYAKPL